MTIFDRVKKVILEQLSEIAENNVTPEASFMEDLEADSLDVVELAMGLEEEFEIEIPDELTDTIVTVGDAVKVVESILEGKPLPPIRREIRPYKYPRFGTDGSSQGDCLICSNAACWQMTPMNPGESQPSQCPHCHEKWGESRQLEGENL